MFNEIYNGFVEILKRGPEEEVEYMKKDKGRVPHLLSLLYDFDPLTIVRVKTIKMSEGPDIVLVLASSPDHNPNIKYIEYLTLDGRLSKLILINIDALMSEEDKDGYSRTAIYAIASSLRSAISGVMNYYFKGLDDNMSEVRYMGRFAKLMYYASPIMIVKLLDRIYGDGKIGDAEMTAMLAVIHNTPDKISIQTIQSIRDLLKGTSLYDLLDNSLLLAADEKAYPGLFYRDNDEDDTTDIEEGDEDKTV